MIIKYSYYICTFRTTVLVCLLRVVVRALSVFWAGFLPLCVFGPLPTRLLLQYRQGRVRSKRRSNDLCFFVLFSFCLVMEEDQFAAQSPPQRILHHHRRHRHLHRHHRSRPHVAGLVLARGGSEGIPLKNLAKLNEGRRRCRVAMTFGS